MSGRYLAALGALLGAAVVAHAGDPEWNALTPQQRQRALQNYQQFQELPASRQRFLERRYERYRALPPGEQQHLQQQYREYRQLSPEERERFNRQYQRWKEQRR